jgi:hypothetical protein
MINLVWKYSIKTTNEFELLTCVLLNYLFKNWHFIISLKGIHHPLHKYA